MSLKQRRISSRLLFLLALILFLVMAGALAAQTNTPTQPPLDQAFSPVLIAGAAAAILLGIFTALQRTIESQGKEITRLNIELDSTQRELRVLRNVEQDREDTARRRIRENIINPQNP